MTDLAHLMPKQVDSESRLAQMALHSDTNTYLNEMLKDAQEDYGDEMFLDDVASDISLTDVQNDEVLNDLEEVE